MSSAVELLVNRAPPVGAQGVANVDSSIVGCTLDYPIYDMQGVLLLLAAGAVVTPQLRTRLKDRRIGQVSISTADATAVSLDSSLRDDGTAPLCFDTDELTQKLDALIDSGSMFLADSGTPARDKLVFHGCRAYDPESRFRLIDQHRATTGALDSMMIRASRGAQLDTHEVATIAATYLTELTSDSDNVLTVASEACRGVSISTHCLQMSMLAMAIGMEYGLDAENVRLLGICGLVHDWGLTKVPAHLRECRRIPSDNEYLGVKEHPIYTLELLEAIVGIPKYVPLICCQVHERPNGTGYPRGRKGESIHKCARILNVADAFVHMTSPQSYRPPLMAYAAMECLLKMAASNAVDPDVVRALLKIQSLFPLGSLVALSDGSIGRVLRRNANDFSHPIVALVQDPWGNAIDSASPDVVVELTDEKLQIIQAIPNPRRKEISLTDEEFQFQIRR